MIQSCDAKKGSDPDATAQSQVISKQPQVSAGQPAVLYLPDSGLGVAPGPAEEGIGFWQRPPAAPSRCPSEMVDVRGEFCIDRYEASLRDQRTQQTLSPFYPPSVAETRRWFERAQRFQAEAKTEAGRRLSAPEPPPYQLQGSISPMAESAPERIPNGYMSGPMAALACKNAGKRLCSAAEWRRACRGQHQTRYPYGDAYQDGACNVFRATHPAGVLHKDPSIHHLDPRLNLVRDSQGPLLQKTGALPKCRSEFGSDAVFDLVGNLDEWVEGPPGLFLGGFYARATRDGCDAEVSSHAFEYVDYSLGFRCCR